jgi:hypothetical protein
MSTGSIETLWREYLLAYSEPRIRNRLQTNWGDDPNVVHGRIQLAYPPTFQPGYVGVHYFDARERILFIGYNPGEGRQRTAQDDDRSLAVQLSAFANGQRSFTELNEFLANHVVRWAIYREKGIFSETGEDRVALLPKALRPSIRTVALLNLFPLKTVDNKKPLAGRGGCPTSLKDHMWEWFVKPTIEAIAPKLIVRYPDSDQYVSHFEQLKSQPRIVRVWHPSNYNLSAQREKLSNSWLAFATELLSSREV